MITKYVQSLILLFITVTVSYAENNTGQDSILLHFNQQLFLFPQEKIYTQTDKYNYLAGDTIWLKPYLVNAISHIPNSTSNYIYAELINPLKEVVTRIKIKKENDIFQGFIPLKKNLPVGEYQLRLYTRYMQNLNEQYFFHKRIRIGNATSVQNPLTTEARIEEDNKFLTVTLKTKETFPATIIPQKVKASTSNEESLPVTIDKDGTFGIELQKPEEREEAVLIEYTYNNTQQKQYIRLPEKEKEFDVAFLPEGGNITTSLMNRIAFKAINKQGAGENIKGYIFNEKGDTLQNFQSQHLGMGFFSFIPLPGEKYYAICQNEKGRTKRFQLPEATQEATTLRVDNHDGYFYISINSNKKQKQLQDFLLLVQCRGNILYNEKWNPKKQVVKLQQEHLPAGVIQALLLDENARPVSERLFFNFNQKETGNLLLETQKTQYTKREPVQVSLRLNDEKGQPLQSFLSVAVTDDNMATPDTNLTILSYLLLASDLKGYIENPAYYFTNPGRLTRQNLDILMMTQGWTRYSIADITRGKYAEPDLLPETAQEISGKVKSGTFLNKPAVHFPVTLFAPLSLQTTVTHTDENGNFIFSNLTFTDSTQLILQANTPKGKNRARLTVDSILFPEIGQLLPPPAFTQRDALKENPEEPFKPEEYLVNGIKNYVLEEVAVSATAPQKEVEGKHWASSFFTKKMTSEEIQHHHASDIYHLLMRVPGVAIWKRDTVYLTRGQSLSGAPPAPPLIIVDNMELPTTLLSSVRPEQVEQIEVLHEPQSFIFGPKGLGGAIIITTKTGLDAIPAREVFNITPIIPLGYQVKKEFYSPKYENEQQNSNIPDFRTTVYWNPDIRTDKNGEGEFSFYTSDASTRYTIIVEGISPEGRLIRAIKNISNTNK